MPASILTQLATTLSVDRKVIANKLGISDRTLTRRLQPSARLTPEESDRAVRLARVVARSIEVLGSPENAADWLRTPHPVLEDRTPFEMLDTDAGVQLVETILGRIAYGIYS